MRTDDSGSISAFVVKYSISSWTAVLNRSRCVEQNCSTLVAARPGSPLSPVPSSPAG